MLNHLICNKLLKIHSFSSLEIKYFINVSYSTLLRVSLHFAILVTNEGGRVTYLKLDTNGGIPREAGSGGNILSSVS